MKIATAVLATTAAASAWVVPADACVPVLNSFGYGNYLMAPSACANQYHCMGGQQPGVLIQEGCLNAHTGAFLLTNNGQRYLFDCSDTEFTSGGWGLCSNGQFIGATSIIGTNGIIGTPFVGQNGIIGTNGIAHRGSQVHVETHSQHDGIIPTK